MAAESAQSRGKIGGLDRKKQMGRKMSHLPIQVNGDNYEPMELDVVEPEERDEIPVLDDVCLDLDSYIGHYHGLPRIQRLEFIADHCKSLRIEALTSAINYIRDNTCNVRDYTKLFKKLQEAKEEQDGLLTAASLQLDVNWIDTKTKQAGLRYEKMDNDLKNSRTNSMKENIRRGHDDMGDHYLDCGELELAFNTYTKSRDFVITHRNQINQCLNMIRVSILLRRWSAVSNHVIKAESQPNNDNPPNPGVATKLHCAAGLFELNSRRYKKAAKHFLSTNFDHFNQPNSVSSGNSSNTRSSGAGPSSSSSASSSGMNLSGTSFVASFNTSHHEVSASQWEILAPINIAVYGSLCALATYSRQELANHLINSASFKQFAELDPQLREAVSRFYESKYASCLSILQEIKSSLLLDMYLAPHVDRLYRAIRNKALVQYFEPYSTASMTRMAEAFNTTVSDLEKEIITLIYEGHIKARIDSHNKILYAQNVVPRTLTFERAIKMGQQWQRQTRAHIIRMAILNAGLVVNDMTLPDRLSH